ncbi:hypothetical protein [Marinobacter sp. SS21]|uniref:hypothetical protein n=1 Tax=Marinobacter sp. SS21 TaxID=2979460 RepID=UPI00232F0AFB|nr:hypothetical protein [Marinobacter sp. SS21]MDC0663737.1 hypothetical protein [Marinobacter sp. SS21]
MTAFASQPLSPRAIAPRGSRKDLLGLAGSAPASLPLGGTQASLVRQLRALGFKVTEMAPQHWVLNAFGGLPELHLYGTEELFRFLTLRATDYAGRLNLPHPNPQETA